MSSSTTAPQQTSKSETEIFRTKRINERVDGRVAVTQPEENGEGDLRRTSSTEDAEDVHGEERRPAQYKTTDDDTDGLGGLLLTVQPP